MQRIPVLVAFVLVLVYSTWSNAQSYHIRSITTEDGLSQSYITSFLEDSRGYVWIGTFYGLNRYDGYEVRAYIPNLLDQWSLHATVITSIVEDEYGLLWLGTDKGIVIFNPFSEKFVSLSEFVPEAPSNFVYDLLTDNSNNVWFISVDNGTNTVYTTQNTKAIYQYLSSHATAPPSLSTKQVNFPEGEKIPIRLFLRTDPYHCLLGTGSGFYQLNLSKKTIVKVPAPSHSFINGYARSTLLLPDNDFNNPIPLHERMAILSSPAGIDVDASKFLFRFFDQNIYSLPSEKNVLTSPDLQQLPIVATLDQPQSFARMIDRNGKIWIGTTGSGIRVLEPVLTAFDYLYPNISFSNPSIMPNNQLWAGMYNPNTCIHLTTDKISSPVWAPYIAAGESVNSSFYDPNSHNIYLVISQAAQQAVFARFDLRQNKIYHIKKLKAYAEHPHAFFKDSQGNIWLAGVGNGLLRYQPASQSINYWNLGYLFPANNHNGQEISRCIAEDNNGRIWIAGDAGLVMVDPSGKRPVFKAFHNGLKGEPVFRSSYIFSVYPDPVHPDLLWLGTLSGGLAKFNIRSEELQYVTNTNNHRFNVVTSIVPDSKGNLWLTTDKGIFHYLPATNAFVDYSNLSHIPQINVNAAAILKTNSKTILLGSNNGLIRIRPDLLPSSRNSGKLCISDITIGRQPIWVGIDQNKIRIDENNRYSLQLTHDDQFISLKFAVPTAPTSEATQYRYRLKGLQEEWIYLGNSHSIEFVRLSPGRYTLETQAISSSGTWSDASTLYLPIYVSPPWYFSIYAWIFYVLLFVFILWNFIRYQRKRMTLRFEADMNRQEMERLKSIDNFKNRFFAYIAHEFKTPLTIIMGASQRLRGQKTIDDTAYPDAIIQEGNNMLYLINELIDVTRLQDKTIQPHYEHRDFISLLNKIIKSYKNTLEINKINLITTYTLPSYYMDLDPLRVQYIINNILSNAIRYTPADGRITIAVKPTSDDRILISIADTGQGIPPDKLPQIFNRYYRIFEEENPSYNFGLGLSFVKELAEILHAEISVDSTPGKGTIFSLLLPVKAPAGAQIHDVDEKTNNPGVSNWIIATNKAGADAPSVLIVDDHPTIQSYLKSVLQPYFQPIVAKNGLEGLKIAIEEIPDLILTDAMMPVMDGVEMTAKLKSNPLTSHIPVVMLSAKHEVQDRLKGQQQGVDVYIGKPFHEQELIIVLHNLYKLQQLWKVRYASITSGGRVLPKDDSMPASFSPDSIVHNDMFIQQILDFFEKNYTSENFDAVELATLLNISKSQLYRKVSNISGEGIMGMLRNFRLSKAAELLGKYPQMTTKEIAYKVGFKEYSHFSSSFKKQFQLSPSEWRKLKNKPTSPPL